MFSHIPTNISFPFSEEQKIRWSRWAFLLEFVLFMLGMTWYYSYHTSAVWFNHSKLLRLTEFIIVVSVLNIYFLCGYTRKQLLEISALLLLLFVSRYFSHNDDGFLLCSMAMALSAHRITPGRMIRCMLSAYIAVCLIVFTLYAFNILKKWDLEAERVRFNFGFSHPNTLGMVIVCFAFVWLILRYNHLKWYDFFGLIGCILFEWFVPNSRTAALVMALLLLLVFLEKKLDLFRFRLVQLGCYLAAPVLAAVSYAASCIYREDSRTCLLLNTLFSDRLRFGHMFLEKYDLTLFGQRITRVNQVTSVNTGAEMQILDNGYLRILLQLGLVTFIVVLAVLTYIMYHSLKEKHYAVTIGLLVLCFYTVSEYFISSLFCNIFLFFFVYYRYGTAKPDGILQQYPADAPTVSDTPDCYACPMPDTHMYRKTVLKHLRPVLLCTCLAAVTFCTGSFIVQIQATNAYHAAYPDGKQEIVLMLSEEELPIVQQYLIMREEADLSGLESDDQNAKATFRSFPEHVQNYIRKYRKYGITDPSQPIIYHEKVPTVWVSKRKAAIRGIEGGILGGTLVLYILFLLYACTTIPEKNDQK